MATASTAIDGADAKALLHVLVRCKRGDFTARMPAGQAGIAGRIAGALNDVIDQNHRLTAEIERLGTVVGKQGHVRHRASLPGARGGWAQSIDAVNALVTDLVQPTGEVVR